jgi:chemotaxis protein MotB
MSDDGPHEEHEEHVNHEAWVIPYADLLTLLMAMFIALFAMSTVDMSKFKELSLGFNEALGGGELSTGVFDPHHTAKGPLEGEGNGDKPLPGGTVGAGERSESQSVVSALIKDHEDLQVAKAAERATFSDIERDLREVAKRLGFASKLSLRLEERGLVVTVVTDQILFRSGSAELEPAGFELLDVIADTLKEIENPILVEGHTDSIPISNSVYRSNWELSGGRAGSVTRFFERAGLDRTRLRAMGLADLFPLGDNRTEAGRAQNRRVEIVIQSKLIDRALRDAGLSHKEVDATGAGDAPVDDPVADDVKAPIDSIAPDITTGAAHG